MIQREDFIIAQEIKDEYLCGICYQLAINAVECQKCETLFCNQCSQDWKKKNDMCINKCEQPFDLKQAHRMIRSEILKIKCQCKYNKFGCQEQLILDQLLQHLQKCQFIPVKCCEQCQWEGQAKELEEHQEKCNFILHVICKQCKQKVLKEQKETHNCFETLINLVQNLQTELSEVKQQSQSKINELEIKLEQQSQLQISIIKQSQIILEQQQQQINNISNIKSDVNPDSTILNRSNSIRQQQLQQQQFQKPPVLQKINPIFKTQGKLGEFSKEKMCKQKHFLRFWLTPGLDVSRQTCSSCLKHQICRYVCEQCCEYFCLICAPPDNMCKGKSSPSYCPSGHKMEQRKGVNYVCDVCGLSGSEMPNSRTLCCQNCDFDICQTCQEQMIKNKECVIF